MKKEIFYAQVVFPLPLAQSFDYVVPPTLREKAAVGQRVRAPFGKKWKVGYLVGLSGKSRLPKRAIKPIGELVDAEPFLDEKLLELSRRIHTYYLCSWGEALEAILPASLRPRKRGSSVVPGVEGAPLGTRTAPLEVEAPLETPPPLSEEQRQRLAEITEGLTQRNPKTFLLFGDPGSEKAELILQVVERYLEKDLSSIILYPEISLSREAFDLFRRRFGKDVCFVHSQLSPLDRYDIWRALKEGRHRVAVGVRSAVFSPVRWLGLIVCCEENHPGYKQEEVPRYHARQVALMRSSLENGSVLLESETPSLESYARALKKQYTLLRLSRKGVTGHPPKVSIVDMREERRSQKRRILFSKYLERKITGILKEKGQILLFLNRRGFSTFVHCRRCGTTLRCEACHVPLKYHFQPKRLVCHYCNAREDPLDICPACREGHLQYTGAGTERVESELHRIFPEAKIARLDADAVKRYGSPESLTEPFRRGDEDVLIGTQMVTRRIVQGGIPLVGILSADTLLNTPNFRSAEHAFAMLHRLICQAAGEEETREGGEVVIQSFSPQHHAILASCSQDYPTFYDQEIRSRKQLGFPPFRFLARITFRGKIEEKVASASQSFKKRLSRFKKEKKISLLGPAPALLGHLKGESQWQLLVKSERENLSDFLKGPLRRLQKSRAVKVIVDIDPY